MIALREVEMNGGSGQVIDLPLLDPLLRHARPAGRQLPPHRQGEAAHRQPLDQHRPAQRLPMQGRPLRRACRHRSRRWPSALFRSIGRPDLIDNPRYRTNADRVKNADELDAIIGAFIARAHAGGERRVLRAGRGHDRPDLRHRADPRGSRT